MEANELAELQIRESVVLDEPSNEPFGDVEVSRQRVDGQQPGQLLARVAGAHARAPSCCKTASSQAPQSVDAVGAKHPVDGTAVGGPSVRLKLPRSMGCGHTEWPYARIERWR